MKIFYLFLCLFFAGSVGLSQDWKGEILNADDVTVGAERMDLYLPLLEGKRVGLIVNKGSLVAGRHLADTLCDLGVNLKVIFGPEHGFLTNVADGEVVEDGVWGRGDNVNIISLYGAKKVPDQKELESIDVLLFDLQDVGTRFYTYISTMELAMQASAKANIQFVVLDRPNPNGFYVDGPILDTALRSFVGMQPLPIVHGLTVGELASLYMGEKWIDGIDDLEFSVIPVLGYTHKDTYFPPVPPSPNLPNLRAILLYPSLCLFEGTVVSVGRGTDYPFQLYGHPSFHVRSYAFTPKPNEGSKYPPLEGENCLGIWLGDLAIEDLLEKSEINLSYIVEGVYFLGDDLFLNTGYFEKLAGTKSLRGQLLRGIDPTDIKLSWKKDINRFLEIRKKYLLYEDFE